jgi:methylated-DNA-[protein]-cysteine S-methyltransferase
MTIHSYHESPLGTLTLVAEGGALTGVYFNDHARRPLKVPLGERDDDAFDAVKQQLDEYFAGMRTSFDVPLAPVGDTFQRRVWNELLRIPYGETRSYGAIAQLLGDKRLARAVGSANGRNPLAIIVPCHRVIGSDGSLTGYAGGLDRKRELLSREGSLPQKQMVLEGLV